jgi:hypothetical protein
MYPKLAICFLVVNKMKELPEISITSAYDRTGAQVFVGYLDKTDLPTLRKDVKVNLLLLENQVGNTGDNLTREYRDFSEDSFYQIVQLKWQLLQKVLEMGYDYLIYSDTDVYWNQDPRLEILNVFERRNKVHIQIQSFTDQPSKPKLCMGFVAFRNSQTTTDFLTECRLNHTRHSQQIGRIGDDDVVTHYFEEKNFPEFIHELPQTTFPVGRMLKIYSKKSKFPGLSSPVPYIFHANYVVGLRNKIILMKVFMKNYSLNDKNVYLGPYLFIILFLKQLRLILSPWKERLLK